MERTYTRINWENEPSILTPLNASNLNKIDSAVYTIDGRVVGFDTTKANQSDLLQCVKQVDYNTTTGVFTFTWQNGTTQVIDLNIEKIPVSFSMDEHGVITMTTSDGTQYTADVGALIKTYTFNDSDVIDFTVTTDASGNKTVTANIVDGSITGDKLQPNYLADCIEAKNDAESASNSADGFKDAAEAWANGKIDGVPVPSTHPAYHNNAEYYKDMANPTQLSSLTDVDLNNPTNRQALVYNTASGKWVNGSGGLLPQMEITTEDGSTVTISKDGETITATSIGSGKYYAEIPEFGEWTVSASKGSQSATRVINVDTVKIYDVNASYFTAYINVTAPNGSSVTVVNGSETYTKATAPYNFEVHSAGTWVVTATKTDASKSKNVVISSDGQTVTTSIAFASITVTYPDEMEFETITATDGTRTYTRVASGTVVFDIANYGEWVVSCMGVSVTVNVTADIDYPIELKSGFDVQEWLQAGSVSGTYASLAEVLADEKALRQLFNKHASVDYLVECCSSDLNKSVGIIIANDLCAKWINLRDYALDTLYANTYIASAMDTADKYFYGEWVLKDNVWQPKGNVPIMTNNSAPYGGTGHYQVFDGNASTSASDTDFWFTFTNPICVKKFECNISGGTLQASNDNGATWTNITNQNSNYYKSYRVHFDSSKTVHTIQFYGRELKVSVPKMTANNAPWGEVSANGSFAEYYPWKAFDGTNTDLNDSWNYGGNGTNLAYIGYKFTNPMICKFVTMTNRNESLPRVIKSFKIQGYKDGSWFDITDETQNSGGNVQSASSAYAITNDVEYEWYRLFVVSVYDTSYVGIGQLQFFGLDYSEHEERHWIYDHGVEVETITPYANGGTAEKQSDRLYLASASTVYSHFYHNKMDFTDYNVVRFVIDDYLNKSVIGCGVNAPSDITSLGYSDMSASAMIPNRPNNLYMSIANINQEAQSVMYIEGASNVGILEWWLE